MGYAAPPPQSGDQKARQRRGCPVTNGETLWVPVASVLLSPSENTVAVPSVVWQLREGP